MCGDHHGHCLSVPIISTLRLITCILFISIISISFALLLGFPIASFNGFFARAPFGPGGLVAECIEPYLYSAVDSRPGPGGSRTTASCQPEARRPRTIPLRYSVGSIASFNGGQYVIRPFKCEVTGKAKGRARVKASIHAILSTFDDEEWSIITLMVERLDSHLKYTDLFAPSCGSIGDITDIKKYDEGYVISTRMQNFNFPVRKFDGTFYEQVHPFDPFFFCAKVHPTGALLFTPHHSQLTLLQHLCIQFQFAKKPLQLLSDVPKYWLDEDGTMSLDSSHRWRSNKTLRWLQANGLSSVPRKIKEEIGSLVYTLDQSKGSDDLATPPGLWPSVDVP